MNDDGYGDIAIGHSLADPGSGNSAGVTYIVLGGGDIQSPLNVHTDLDGSNGFTLVGASAGDRSGTSVSDAGVSCVDCTGRKSFALCASKSGGAGGKQSVACVSLNVPELEMRRSTMIFCCSLFFYKVVTPG